MLWSSYHLTRDQLVAALGALMRSKELVMDRTDLVAKALRMFANRKADFAGCLIERLAAAAGCSATMTFDAGAAKTAGMTLVP